MRCLYCQSDSDDPCVPDEGKKVFDSEIDRLNDIAKKIDEDISCWEEAAKLYAASDEDASDEDETVDDEDDSDPCEYAGPEEYEDDEDDDDGHDGEWVKGPFNISDQELRVYHYWKGNQDVKVMIDDPLYYYISESGDHLVIAEDEDVGVFIPAGFTHYEVFPRAGFKPFDIE